MIAPDGNDCAGYEPDWEDLAYLEYQQEAFKAFRTEYGYITRELLDYDKHTDRQLRELSKEGKAISSELWHKYRFVAEADYFGSETPPAHVLTRKDKRQIKTERRRAGRYLQQLGFLTTRGCSPRQVSGYEDRSFDPVVAATWHA